MARHQLRSPTGCSRLLGGLRRPRSFARTRLDLLVDADSPLEHRIGPLVRIGPLAIFANRLQHAGRQRVKLALDRVLKASRSRCSSAMGTWIAIEWSLRVKPAGPITAVLVVPVPADGIGLDGARLSPPFRCPHGASEGPGACGP